MRLINRCLSGVLLRYLLVAALGAAGIEGAWLLFWPAASAKSEAPAVETSLRSRAGQVMLALDQVVLTAKEYARTGDRAERDEFDRKVRAFYETVELLRTASEVEERRIAEALTGHMTHIEVLGREVLASPDPRIDVAALSKVHQLAALREQAVPAVNDLHEVDVRRAKAAEGSGGIDGIVGGGFVALGLSLAGGIGLARFAVG